jgi:hypothetical protein
MRLIEGTQLFSLFCGDFTRSQAPASFVKRSALFVIAATLVLSTPSWATTRNAASCSASDVQTAVNASVTGDIVIVPGPCTTSWGSNVSIAAAQGITIEASGTVTVNSDGFVINMGSVSSRITGFSFTESAVSCSSAATPIITAGGSLSSAPFRIDHNTFTSTAQVIDICVKGADGLIDDNTFNIGGASEVIHLNDQGGGSGTWADNATPGSGNMVYIDTNTFNNSDTGALCSAEESYNDAQFVFRYNTLYGCQNDVHDGGNGGRWGEIYDNTYHQGSLSSLANFVQWRGGSGVFYSNHKVSVSAYTQFGPDCPSSDTCSGTWIVPQQVGAGINQTTHSPAYIWGNDSGMSPDLGVSTVPFVVGGSGPTDATNCSAHAGNVCDYILTASQPVTLLECETTADVAAGCPVAHAYTAFAYPYPLTSGGMPDPTGGKAQPSPTAPINVLGASQVQ